MPAVAACGMNYRIKLTHLDKVPNHLEKVLHKLVKRFTMTDLKPPFDHRLEDGKQ